MENSTKVVYRCNMRAQRAADRAPLSGRRLPEEAGAAGVVLQIVQLPLSRIAQHLRASAGGGF